MSHKKLNLDEIQDEILDECFENDNTSIDELLSDDYDDEEAQEVDPDIESTGLTISKIKSSVKQKSYVSNEELVNNVQNGIDVEESKKLLVLFNSGLVYNEAKNCTCNIPFQDKVQYGFEGFMKAIYGYNNAFNTRFSTYATTSIRQHMYRNGNNDVRLVALPEHLSVSNIKIQNFIERSVSNNNGYPSNEEIAKGTGINLSYVKRIMNYNSNTFSIDTPMSRNDEGSEQTLKDIIAGESPDYYVDERTLSKDFSTQMDEVLDDLEEHERVIVSLIHGLDGYKIHTLEEILNSGYIDGTGNFVSSIPTLSRRYHAAMDKVRIIVDRKNIDFNL